MSLGTLALHQLEAKLPKVISPSTHGIIDYCHAAFFATMAGVLWNRNRRAAVACASTSALVLGGALLTDYKYGVEPLIPFEVHGQLDSGSVAASLALPRILGFEKDRSARIFTINAIVVAAVVGLTDWNIDPAHAK